MILTSRYGIPIVASIWKSLAAHEGPRVATNVRFTEEGVLVSVGSDEKIRHWDVAAMREIQVLKTELRGPSAAVLLKGGTAAYLGRDQERGGGTLGFSNLRTGEHTQLGDLYFDDLCCVAADDDAGLLAMGGLATYLVSIPHRQVLTQVGQSLRVHALAFVPGQQTLVTAGQEGSVRLWSCVNPAQASVLLEEGSPAQCLDLQQSTLAIGRADGTITIWDLAQRALDPTVRRHLPAVTSLRISHDGELLYSGSSDGTILCWKLP